MNASPVVISFENIEKNFGSLKVLQGITGEIHQGEVVAVIGTSGCGKSTLLRCFNRLETIDGGNLAQRRKPHTITVLRLVSGWIDGLS